MSRSTDAESTSWVTRRRLLGGFAGIATAEILQSRAAGQSGNATPVATPSLDQSGCGTLPKRQIVLMGSPKLKLTAQDLQDAADLINAQIQNDVSQFWKVNAEIITKKNVSDDDWRVQVYQACVEPAKYQGNGHTWWASDACLWRPHGWVRYDGDDSWIFRASHECLELVVNPFVQRFMKVPDPGNSGSDVYYNVEVCDPCSIADPSYRINGKVVSDFVTPAYYDPSNANKTGVQYNFLKTIHAPLQPVLGSYQNFLSLDGKTWSMTTWTSKGYYNETLPNPGPIDTTFCPPGGAPAQPALTCPY
jgi:hypothetical protein